ncbi:hypothetical protein Zmor_013777 [Zophobas morio]|uniref:Uncharacterized protein n=1 Tax=Zophobas morio TaxID=2755281 RepID=A0AA38IG26_9CUCU|nr:hypothetical protein Zmor_013777 [Zophobas morio]
MTSTDSSYFVHFRYDLFGTCGLSYLSGASPVLRIGGDWHCLGKGGLGRADMPPGTKHSWGWWKSDLDFSLLQICRLGLRLVLPGHALVVVGLDGREGGSVEEGWK